MNDPTFIHEFLVSRGWTPSGYISTRKKCGGGREKITWWKFGEREYPQHFALDLERLNWTKILETTA